MARSKFPGKPSKPVNRTRINVLPASTIREDSILNLPKDSKLTDDDCDEVLQITNESNTSMVLNCSSQRVVRRKRVCKRIIVRRSSITKLIHTSSSNSQKFKNSITDQAHFTRKKTDKRPDREILSNRKIVKQALEGSNVVGKFVLPIRSVHSSRVIKPNKRFLNVEAVNSVRTFKKRVVNKKTSCIQRDNNLEVDTSTQDEEESADTSISRTPCSTRRIILRQARLQLHTQTPIGPEGPFSSNSSSSSNSPPGTVTCGVCGAVRFYRFVKQARKFNIYSCESCRKFISKMIKRQMCNKKLNEVQCLKGQGVCHVPPIVRSQHWKFRCAYKARCNACWLKMCLRSFQMPSSLKINLVNLLPKFMRESDTLFNNSISLFSFHTNSKTVIKPLSSSFMDSGKVDSLPLRKRPLRKVPAKNLEKLSLSLISNIKRQKVDFKGPRVKHVCRSASIVLGQPLAIFPDESNTTRVEVVENGVINVNSPTVTNGINILGNKEKDVLTERQGTELKVNISNSSEIETKNSTKIQPQVSSTVVKREKDKNKLPAILNGDDDSRKRQRELENNICVDFWENYDLEEVYQNGFGLISSVSFPMLAICFLCGSSGCDPLLFCCLCCEPYHPFCLEQIPQNIKANEKCYDWLCPRCTMCSTCGQTDKQKFNCQKCYKAYHLECFNTKLQTEDRPKVCSSCLRCRSCGKNNITKFIGNTPLCLMCFRLRNKGNFCPICQRCYDEKDYDTKMMECGKCNKWIHSKCEGLSEEQYQILSLLPESIEFMCCLCESKPIWRKAVDVELRSNFNAVLRLLSKNRVARNILKWSPVCCSPRISKNVISARKLQFSDDSDMCDSEEEDSSELSKRCKQKFKSKEARVVSKACGAEENVSSSSLDDKVPLKTINTLTDIKNKLSCKEYFSLKEFNEGMEEIVKLTKSSKLLEIYNSIMKQIFPWYDSNLNDSDYLNTSFCDVSQIVTKSEDIKGSLDYCRFKLANNIDVDIRICSLCKAVGDGVYYEEGRLLYCGNNEWIHANCAMWSSEVYEEIDGSLQNVQSAIIRGRSIRCTYCKQKGASIGCCAKSCHETYHFLCAQTVKCHFMHDKSIYCPSHNVIKNSAVISSSSDFAINRSIYVELDKKKKRFTESKKIQFMVGSLCVTSIGNVVPTLSDNSEAIIPLNLSCRRLFWSTREPWKLVSYTITTHVLKPQTCEAVIDKNFTVDHTLPKIILDKKLKEIFLWQKDVDNANNESSETDYEEEPQNEKDADILFPELTDAILEELPRDLLDGISMQDIFPKLLSNDELLGVNNADSEQKKFLYSEETKDNKNDNFQLFNSNKISKNRNLGRSCSVTLSCKVGNPLSSSTKQIKSLSQDKSMFLQLLQVDGAYDYSSSSDSEPEDVWNADAQDEPVKCGRCQCTYRTQASYKRHLESCEVISTSESDSETPEQEQMEISHCGTVGRSISFQENPSPYTVTSYESYSSHQTIQNLQQTCINKEPVPAITQSSEIFVANFQPVVEQKFISDTISLNSQPQMSAQVVSMNQQSSLPVNQITINESNELCINQPSPLYISQSNCSSLVNHSGIQILQPQPITINRVPQTPLQINIQPSPMMNLSSSEEIQKNAILNQFLKPTQKVMVPSVNQKYAKSRGRPKTITCKRTRPIESKTYYVPPATMGAPPVVVQQLPSNNMVPTFVEAFQQQTGQNLQYITTITPQITSAVQNQPPIMHFQSDNTLLNFVSGVQPTVILPQTRVLTDSLMIDNNGSLVWAPQPTQPIFYGFETIVQNTVLQSQQFLPGTIPGVLTANSSYSSTTQVFQTSKMESVLDVTSGNILYLNSAPVVNPQPMQVPQTISSSIPTNPPLVLQESKPTVSWSYLEPPPEPLVNEKVAKPVQTFIPAVVNTNNGVHSINLPVAPFTPEPGIPTNVVPPTPKPISITSHSRPMNRVLPMPTNNPKLTIKAAPKKVILEKPNLVISKCERSLEKPKAPKIKIVDDVIIKPVVQPIVNKTETSSILAKPPLKPLKENREQNSEQIFKVNNFNSKKNAAVHIATLRPIKTKNVLNDQNIQEKPVVDAPAKEDKKSFNDKQKSAIMYTIETQDGFHYTSNSVQDLWSKVFDAVQAARLAHDMPPLPPGSFGTINNLQVLGLKSNGLKYLLEQLPGAAKCVKYKHIFHHQTPDVDVDDDFDTINHRDAIKCVPYITSNEPSDMFGWLASKHRKPPLCNFNDFEQLTRRGSIINLPMAMRFRHLKLTSKQSVGVYRSRIHKRGLFCHRDIESGEMVIEYAGEVIRSVLADKREKQYTVKGMGCYMFRIDENFVVDATMKGNAARFINHSCEPNCYSKVVEILGHKHIIIFALRKIQCAEELTYDYKFPFEEDKIPCTCGSRRCRKFLN